MAHLLREEDKPTMPGILKEDDLLDKTMAPKQGEGKLFQSFKKEIAENLHLNAGCIAFAKKMCDNPEFYRFVESAVSEREKRGYKYEAGKDVYKFVETEIFNLRSILSEVSGKESFRYANLPSRIPKSKMGYEDLKRIAESDYEVRQEASALNTLFENYRKEFESRLIFLTLHFYVPSHRATIFMEDLLKIMRKKKLYEGEFKSADIGTGSGEFSAGLISFIREKFGRYHIVRTNPLALEVKFHKNLEVRIHDISREALGEKFNLILIKDVMKLFKKEEAKGKIWDNVKQSTAEGGIVISGGQGDFRPHVLYNDKLVRVNSEEFLFQLGKVKNYQDYLNKLDDIVKSSSITRGVAEEVT